MSTQPQIGQVIMPRLTFFASLFALALFTCPLHAEVAAPPTSQPSDEPAEKNDPVVRPMRAARSIKRLKAAPLYSFNEKDVDAYLKFLADDEKDPLKRVVHLARKNIG